MLPGLLRLCAAMIPLAVGGWMARALHGVRAALGARPATIRALAGGSPNFRDGAFVNLEPASLFTVDRQQQRHILREVIGGHAATRPGTAIPLATPEVVESPASGLAVSWLGHSTALLEIDGYRVLTDPVFSDR
jgi:hypothetical protein